MQEIFTDRRGKDDIMKFLYENYAQKERTKNGEKKQLTNSVRQYQSMHDFPSSSMGKFKERDSQLSHM